MNKIQRMDKNLYQLKKKDKLKQKVDKIFLQNLKFSLTF